MIDHGKRNVLGVLVDAIDYQCAVEKVAQAACEKRPFAVSALAVHGVMTGVLDSEHRYRLNSLDLVAPDGHPVRWALNRLYRTALDQPVKGPELMLLVCERAARDGLPIFLYGGTDELLAKLRERLLSSYPHLQIAGMRASRFRQLTPEEKDEAAASIRASGAAITLVGLGCPRQEVWVYEFRDAISMPVLAVGAAFNFHAGVLAKAPRAMADRGLEWLYRLWREPRRLWRRYVLLNPLYIGMLTLQLAHLRRFDPTRVKKPTREILYG